METNVKDKLINMAWVWDKENNLSPWQESKPWPPEHHEVDGKKITFDSVPYIW